jgi:hypothetical protein
MWRHRAGGGASGGARGGSVGINDRGDVGAAETTVRLTK